MEIVGTIFGDISLLKVNIVNYTKLVYQFDNVPCVAHVHNYCTALTPIRFWANISRFHSKQKSIQTSRATVRPQSSHIPNMPRGAVYECKEPLCKQVIIGRTAFTLHKKEHTLEKPYACRKPNCDKRYTQKRHLIMHMRVHAIEDTNEREEANVDEKLTPDATLDSHTAQTDDKPGSPDSSGSPGQSICPTVDVAADLQEQLSAANVKINELRDKCAQLEAENEKSARSNDSNRKWAADSQKQLTAANDEINQLKDKCVRLEADNEKWARANDSYSKCVADAMKLFSCVSGHGNE